MLCRSVRIEIFEETSKDDLEAAVNTWLEERQEEGFLSIHFDTYSTTTFWAYVTYAPE
jgi:hypothetical protein